MGIAALVIGILSLIGGTIPLMGILFIFTAVIGLIFGIVDAVIKSKKKQPKPIAIAGIVLCAFDVIGIIVYNILLINFFPFV